MNEGKRLNLNGEFLGVTALAVYSAPWFLQPLLIILVGMMFLFKVFEDSTDYVKQSEERGSSNDESGARRGYR